MGTKRSLSWGTYRGRGSRTSLATPSPWYRGHYRPVPRGAGRPSRSPPRPAASRPCRHGRRTRPGERRSLVASVGARGIVAGAELSVVVSAADWLRPGRRGRTATATGHRCVARRPRSVAHHSAGVLHCCRLGRLLEDRMTGGSEASVPEDHQPGAAIDHMRATVPPPSS